MYLKFDMSQQIPFKNDHVMFSSINALQDMEMSFKI